MEVEFRQREFFAYACEAYSEVIKRDKKHRVAFAQAMEKEASSFPEDSLREIQSLVLSAATARNGWKVILKKVTGLTQ